MQNTAIKADATISFSKPPYFHGLDYLQILFAISVVAWHTKALGVDGLFQHLDGRFSPSFIDIIYCSSFLLAVPLFMLGSLFIYVHNRKQKDTLNLNFPLRLLKGILLQLNLVTVTAINMAALFLDQLDRRKQSYSKIIIFAKKPITTLSEDSSWNIHRAAYYACLSKRCQINITSTNTIYHVPKIDFGQAGKILLGRRWT